MHTARSLFSILFVAVIGMVAFHGIALADDSLGSQSDELQAAVVNLSNASIQGQSDTVSDLALQDVDGTRDTLFNRYGNSKRVMIFGGTCAKTSRVAILAKAMSAWPGYSDINFMLFYSWGDKDEFLKRFAGEETDRFRVYIPNDDAALTALNQWRYSAEYIAQETAVDGFAPTVLYLDEFNHVLAKTGNEGGWAWKIDSKGNPAEFDSSGNPVTYLDPYSVRMDKRIEKHYGISENGFLNSIVKTSFYGGKPPRCTYNRREHTPTIYVDSLCYISGLEGEEGVNYDVTYRNNVNAGTAEAIITGKGIYAGLRRVMTFQIGKSTPSWRVYDGWAIYNGKPQALDDYIVYNSTGSVSFKYYSDEKCTREVRSADVKNVGTYYAKATIASDTNYEEDTRICKLVIDPQSLWSAKVSGLVSKAYTSKAVKQIPIVKWGSLMLKDGRDFTVSYKNNKKVGTATVIVKGKGNFIGSKSAKFKIVKYKQPMTAKANAKSAKASVLKKKAVSLSKPVTVKKAKGKVSYSNASTAKSTKVFKVNAKTGKITIPKGTKKGAYKVKVKVIAKGSGNYAYGEKTVTVKIKVK